MLIVCTAQKNHRDLPCKPAEEIGWRYSCHSYATTVMKFAGSTSQKSTGLLAEGTIRITKHMLVSATIRLGREHYFLMFFPIGDA